MLISYIINICMKLHALNDYHERETKLYNLELPISIPSVCLDHL